MRGDEFCTVKFCAVKKRKVEFVCRFFVVALGLMCEVCWPEENLQKKGCEKTSLAHVTLLKSGFFY